MGWYKTGTVAMTSGNTTVTGTGTSWIANASAGMGFRGPNRELYEIASVTSDTTLVLATAYGGSTATGQAYSLLPTQDYIRELAAQTATLVTEYSTFKNNLMQGKFGNGTAALPGVNFGGTGNGLFLPATNEVALSTAGAERVRVLADGKVGIGTTAPGYKLDVASGTSTNALRMITDAGVDVVTTYRRGTTDVGNVNGVFDGLYLKGSQVIRLDTSGSEKARLTATGVLGLGTVTPTDYTSSGYKSISIAGTTGGILEFQTGTTQQARITGWSNSLAFHTNNVERVRIGTGGAVGIGVTSPNFKLHIDDTGAACFFQMTSATTGSTTGDGFIIGTGTTGEATLLNRENTAMRFHTNNSERMIITAAGNVGVGTASPNYAPYGTNTNVLSIKGNATYGALEVVTDATPANNISLGELSFVNAGATTSKQSAAIVGFQDGTNAATPGGRLVFYTRLDGGSISERMRIDNTGNVGIGTNSPQRGLHLAGATGTSFPAIRLERTAVRTWGLEVQNDGNMVVNDNTAGVTRLIMSPAGIGIGTTTPPTAKLHIYQATGASNLNVENGGTTAGNFSQLVMSTGTGAWSMGTEGGTGRFFFYNNGAAQDQLTFSGGTNSNLTIRALGTGTASIYTANAERLVVDAAGSLGLRAGSAAFNAPPAVSIARVAGEVAGYGDSAASDSGFLRLSAGGGSTLNAKSFIDITGYHTTTTSGAADTQTIRFGTAGAEAARFDVNGRLGIATTTPTTALDVNTNTIRVRQSRTPASATAAGNVGDHCWDANYEYRCVAPNTWKRFALTTW